MEFKDYYRIMGIERDASQIEIKRKYRQLARKFHPDVSKEVDAEAKFKELGEANEVLKDSEKRAAYDRLGKAWKEGQDFHPPPDWNSGFEFTGDGLSNDDAAQFSEFFESLYGRDFSRGRQNSSTFHVKGEDRHAKVLIDLEDSYSGATRIIMLKAPEIDLLKQVTMREYKLNVTIPRGIRAGQHIRLVGQGAAGSRNDNPGDLYLEILFRTHSLYRIELSDVYLDLPIAPWEAALGVTLTAPTPGGVVEIKIPAGSASGNKLRLKGRGIPGNTPGDFYVVLQTVLPAVENEPDKEAYRNLATQFKNFNPRIKLGV